MLNEPYTLTIDGKLQGFYESLRMALHAAATFRKSGASIKVYFEGASQQQLVHEE
jgi:hypothetical protein